MELMYAYPLEDDDFKVRAAWFESMGFREPDPLTTYRADIEDVLHVLRQELDL